MYKMLKMIFLNLGNDIHSNCEAGIDIRKNADPIVQVSLSLYVRYNCEAGIDIRKNADPIVQVSLSLYVRYNTKSDWMSN